MHDSGHTVLLWLWVPEVLEEEGCVSTVTVKRVMRAGCVQEPAGPPSGQRAA